MNINACNLLGPRQIMSSILFFWIGICQHAEIKALLSSISCLKMRAKQLIYLESNYLFKAQLSQFHFF